jgi:hypothetical protein
MPRTVLSPDDPVYEKIAEICRPRVFDEVIFEPLFNEHISVLSVTAAMPPFSGGAHLTLWRGPRDGRPRSDGPRGLWIAVQRSPRKPRDTEIQEVLREDKYLGLDVDQKDSSHIALAAGTLLRLYETAEPGHSGLTGVQRQRSFDQLNDACRGFYGTREPEALHPGEHEHEEDKPWYAVVDQFADLCRRGPLHHVWLDPSPYGGVDITAHIWPPRMKESVPVRIFHHQGPGESLPGHWYGVGDQIASAHAAFVDYERLCAGYPDTSHAFIEHALDGHLHAMAHIVYEVIDARLAEKVDFLRSLISDEHERMERAQELAAPAWSDSLAGFRGLAMMYTGSPDD